MLQTLPESYRHVRSAWTNVPRDEKTLDNLAQRLIAEEGVVASYAVQTPAPPTNSVAFQATVPESRVDNAHYATNRGGQRGRGRGGFRGRGGRGNYGGPRGGGVNQHAPKQEGANLETPQKIWNCIYCEIDSHHTVDCRKLISARTLAKEHFTKKDSGYPASACYLARSVFDWFADSGATSHMTDQLSILMD